jgi:DNA-binding transcriptional MerR regulator
MFTAQGLYTIGQVAQQIGISRSRLAYLVESGQVPQPSASVPGRRLFTTSDIQLLTATMTKKGEGTHSAQSLGNPV